ncbi:hypothetical protein CDAR_56031 [Caerostris darwini]|uniref:Uncharacterized protein n=1 Tax=Caerostris darwini TaxID=1538125 RepID=A0AAV4RSA6_9ARAC|nr:hypothetical protein CDAR_56031 [Caerostris darwini]
MENRGGSAVKEKGKEGNNKSETHFSDSFTCGPCRKNTRGEKTTLPSSKGVDRQLPPTLWWTLYINFQIKSEISHFYFNWLSCPVAMLVTSHQNPLLSQSPSNDYRPTTLKL